MPPLIAVGGRHLKPGSVPGWPDRGALAVPDRFIKALHRAGAREAVLLPTEIDPGEASDLLGRFDGLLLTGGGDIVPARYGARTREEIRGADPARDEFEVALALAALDRGMPLLAVCRGAQVLNVALGGTLDPHIQDRVDVLTHEGPGTEEFVMHPVRLESGSRTAWAMGVERPDCPSSHHQALEKLGDGLVATGWSDDGLVEATEHEDAWAVGVQWHPEVTAASDPAQQGLFDALAEQAGTRRR